MSAPSYLCEACGHFWRTDEPVRVCPECGNAALIADEPSTISEARIALALANQRMAACRARIEREGAHYDAMVARDEAEDEQREALVDLAMAYVGGRT